MKKYDDGIERKRIGTMEGLRDKEKMEIEWQKLGLESSRARVNRYGHPSVLGVVGINIHEFFVGLLKGKVE